MVNTETIYALLCGENDLIPVPVSGEIDSALRIREEVVLVSVSLRVAPEHSVSTCCGAVVRPACDGVLDVDVERVSEPRYLYHPAFAGGSCREQSVCLDLSEKEKCVEQGIGPYL